MKLPMLPQDKANHAIYGALVALVALVLAPIIALHFHVSLGHMRPRDIALSAAVAAGALKEGLDAYANWRATGNIRRGPHGVEGYDFLATSCGGALVWASSP